MLRAATINMLRAATNIVVHYINNSLCGVTVQALIVSLFQLTAGLSQPYLQCPWEIKWCSKTYLKIRLQY